MTVLDTSTPQWAEMLSGAAELTPHSVPGAMDTFMLIFTSGTSGNPKPVQFAHMMMPFAGPVLADKYDIGPGDVCYLSMPLFHSNAVLAGWSVALNSGAAMAPAEKSLNFGASARRLIGLLKPHRLRVIAVLALSVTAVVMNVVAPKVLGKAVDAVFAGSVSMHLPLGSTKAQAVAALRASGQSKMADMVAAMDLVPGAGIDFDRVATILLTVVALYVVVLFASELGAVALGLVIADRLRAAGVARLARRGPASPWRRGATRTEACPGSVW